MDMEMSNVHRRTKGNSDEKQRSISDSIKRARPMLPQRQNRGGKDVAFWIAVVLSQVVGLACVGLVIYWCKLYGGFAWSSNADLQFYYHPLLMVLGLVFCYGDALIVYRVLGFLPKWNLKLIHASLHVCAILFSSIALAAVLENHRRTKRADFYSLHSWIGIATFAFFCLQYVAGFITFLLPWVPNVWRGRAMPFHVFLGLGLFVTAVATAQMGITEKLLWTANYTTNQRIHEGVVGNCLGLCMVLFAFLIIFITTRSAYKRRPLPEEMPVAAPTN